MLKSVCAFAICLWTFPGEMYSTKYWTGTRSIVINMIVPIKLNRKWINAALLAFLLAPTLEIIAVVVVPILSPNNIPNAWFILIAPCIPNASNKPIDAEEDCKTVVNNRPANTPINGLFNLTSIFLNHSSWANGANPLVIIDIPKNKIPNPISISAISFFLSLLAFNHINTPIAITKGAYFEISKAIIWAVIVVPTLAPMIIPTDCAKVINPAFTKPIVIIVVAELDWIIIVTKIPTNTA